ncbi:MAG: Uma2 family endonuclease [Gemmatimonadetes bacterium]|nr:Uma2 family endonuclease [Gemmatimonadota bacterium]
MAYPQRMATEWTAAMVAALPDDGNRYEVLDGELAVTPAPSWDHQRVALALCGVLSPYLRANALGEAIVAPADVEFSSRRLLEPDVFVVPRTPGGVRPRSYADAGRLLLAIEVLSPSTARRDRGIKRRIYMGEQVDEYWIVDADAWCIERWRRGDERPEIVTETLEWRPEGAGEALEIDVQRVCREALE